MDSVFRFDFLYEFVVKFDFFEECTPSLPPTIKFSICGLCLSILVDIPSSREVIRDIILGGRALMTICFGTYLGWRYWRIWVICELGKWKSHEKLSAMMFQIPSKYGG